jgi:hypothetical protein
MCKRTIIFKEYRKITIKEIDELFYFTILFHDKGSSRNIIKESEYIVVAACRGLREISLEKVNGTDYLFITDDISDFAEYPKQIDNFLSMQCDNGNKVTAKMLYHAILDSTNELFPKMRLTDIYYNYKYLSEIKTGNSEVDIYTNYFDKYINDIFPNSKSVAVEKIMLKFSIVKEDAILLFERWQKFHLIDYHPYEEWIPNTPKETLTIEQFKERMSVAKIDVIKDENTGELYFKAGNIKGEVCIKGIPKRPMLSLFITSDSETHWLLHEEGNIYANPILIDF